MTSLTVLITCRFYHKCVIEFSTNHCTNEKIPHCPSQLRHLTSVSLHVRFLGVGDFDRLFIVILHFDSVASIELLCFSIYSF